MWAMADGWLVSHAPHTRQRGEVPSLNLGRTSATSLWSHSPRDAIEQITSPCCSTAGTYGWIDRIGEHCDASTDADLPVCEVEREPDASESLRTYGAVVQALREHAGLSRVQFGELVRFSKHTVESVELGRRMPDRSFVERAEEALGNTGALRTPPGI
jgi:hypothetical protein